MKRFALGLSLFVALLIWLLVFSARAGTTTVFGNLITVTSATTNSAVIQTNTVAVSIGTFFISNGGVPSTNAFTGARQFSLDGTNFVTVGAIYTPAATNATTDVISPAILSFPIYMRMSGTVTGAVSIGAIYLSPN